MIGHRERTKPKRLNLKEGINLEKLLETHLACHFLLEKKKRLCGLSKTPGSQYCGIHRAEVGETTILSRAEKQSARVDGQSSIADQRISCPRCGDSLFKRNLKRHLQVCNFAASERELKKKPYYKENCNSSSTRSKQSRSGAGDVAATAVNPDELLRKVKACFETFKQNLEQQSAFSSQLTSDEEKVMREVGGEQSSQSRLRHARQDALIVRQVRKLSEEKGKNVYIEMGAGAGALGYAAHCADPESNLVFVERAGTGKKSLDRTLRRRKLEHKFYRARIDIRHCLITALPGVEEIQTKTEEDNERGKVIVIAKHLCGNASDLAINSIHAPQHPSSFIPSTSSVTPLEPGNKGLVVATCCHHRCLWEDYVGREWLSKHGFTAAEFEVLTHWSGWGTGLSAWWSGIKSSRRGQDLEREIEGQEQEQGQGQGRGEAQASNERDEEERDGSKRRKLGDEGSSGHQQEQEQEEEEDRDHTFKPSSDFPRPAAISKEGMAQAGFMTKRVLDQGRCEALAAAGYSAKQVQFCSPRDSPECYCVVAGSWKA